MGQNGSSSVLMMSVSAIVPEKSRENKKNDKDSFARWHDYSQESYDTTRYEMLFQRALESRHESA